MYTNHTPPALFPAMREGERGAALITALLISTLLLLAGGALLAKTTGSVAIAYGSTAEMQSYYSAEAGLQSALNILRGNVQNAGGDAATFRNAVDKNNGTLAAWIGYDAEIGGTAVKKLPGNSFSVVVTVPPGTANVAGTEPQRVLITSTGYGPRGSRKQMEMLLRSTSAIDVPGAVTLRGTTSGGAGNIFFDLGTSAKRQFLSEDPTKPVFVTTNGTDSGVVQSFVDGDKSQTTYSNPALGNTAAGTAKLPEFLTDPKLTEQLIQDLMTEDVPGDNITIINGDGELPKDGQGILLCTGKLTAGGNSVFRGIILVLGKGYIEWKGEGTVTGAIFLANYDRVALKEYDAVTLDVRGAGTSTITYSPDAVNNALRQLSFRVVGVQER